MQLWNGRMIRVSEDKVTVVASFPHMDWGLRASETKAAFYESWKHEIARNGDAQLLCASDHDVHMYLYNAVKDVMSTKSWKGLCSGPGTQWASAAPANTVAALLWSDGSRGSQESPLDEGSQAGCRWWPCVVVPSDQTQKAFYCPGLAWNRARPRWAAHQTRLRLVAWLAPGGAHDEPPTPPPVAPPVFNTSTVTIEELGAEEPAAPEGWTTVDEPDEEPAPPEEWTTVVEGADWVHTSNTA